MKYLLILIPIFCFGQSKTNENTGVLYPKNITPYSIIELKTGDTLQWFWNRSEVKTAILNQHKTDSSNNYLLFPLYGTGVFSTSTTATITTANVKSSSIIQVGWYGTSAIHSNTATAIYVPSSLISDGINFVVKSSQSQSDSFYYFIWTHY